MELKGELGGIANYTNGFRPPRPGEGAYLCRKCGKRFNNRRSRILSEIIGEFFVRCPECRSFWVVRDPMVTY